MKRNCFLLILTSWLDVLSCAETHYNSCINMIHCVVLLQQAAIYRPRWAHNGPRFFFLLFSMGDMCFAVFEHWMSCLIWFGVVQTTSSYWPRVSDGRSDCSSSWICIMTSRILSIKCCLVASSLDSHQNFQK